MIPEIARLRREVSEAEAKFSSLEGQLDRAIKNCPHNWSNPVSDPELVNKAYYVEPVKQGSDYWAGGHVPEKWRDRWRRHCPLCDTTQYTYQAETKVVESKIPKF